jgi:hypothetical protein
MLRSARNCGVVPADPGPSVVDFPCGLKMQEHKTARLAQAQQSRASGALLVNYNSFRRDKASEATGEYDILVRSGSSK